jgi:O-antigen/teichoic acid export membrane protein
MLITMGVSLYTSRIVLSALGKDDFGIYGVVGSIVAMFLFLNNALSSSTSRYLTYALGENDYDEMNRIFNASLLIHVTLAFIIVVFAETVGLWFLNVKLVIHEGKMTSARIVFQFSVMVTALSVISVPFNSLIIAREKMNVYAYFAVTDSVFKLFVAMVLLRMTSNRLVYYAFLLFIASLANTFAYVVYCRIRFRESRFKIVRQKSLYKSLAVFTSWSLFGNVAYVGYTQGLNILLNMFFGTIVNAARAVSFQVENAIRTFAANFQTAINPQIIKSYAQNDFEYMHALIHASSRYSFYALLFISMPIMFETELILSIWLKNAPEYSVPFIRIMIPIVIMEVMSNSIMTSATATGKIKMYHSVVGGLLMLIVPISYFALKTGLKPTAVFHVYFVIEIIACVARVLIVRPMIKLSLKKYFNDVVVTTAKVCLLSCIVPILAINFLDVSVLRLVVVTVSCATGTFAAIYFAGLKTNEKRTITSKFKNIIHK